MAHLQTPTHGYSSIKKMMAASVDTICSPSLCCERVYNYPCHTVEQERLFQLVSEFPLSDHFAHNSVAVRYLVVYITRF